MSFLKERKNILKDTSRYTISSFIVQAIGIVTAIIVRRGLGPALMGVWELLKVILQYSLYSDLGISAVAYRDIPYQLGKDNKEEATKIKNVCFTYTIGVSILISLGLIVWSFCCAGRYPIQMTIGIRIVGLILILTSVYNFYITMLRAHKNFIILSRVIVINALLMLGGAFYFIPRMNIYGMFLTVCLASILCTGYIYISTKYRIKLFFEAKEFMYMLKTGVPMLLSGMGFVFLLSIDKVMIAKFLGFEAVGLYTIAAMAIMTIFTIPKSFGIVFFPSMQEHYGRTDDIQELRSYLVHPLWSIVTIMPLFIGVSYYLIPVIVRAVLPKYVPGIEAFKVLMWGAPFLCASYPSSIFFITINKQMRLAKLSFFIIIASLGIIYLFIQKGAWISGVALGMSISYLIYFLVLTVDSLKNVMAWGKIAKTVLIVVLTCVYYLICIVVVDKTVSNGNYVLEAFFRTGIFLLLGGIFLTIVNKMNFDLEKV
ncbi:oligosaccharide flippase family protein [Candidatus Omnitrophota bacterium]